MVELVVRYLLTSARGLYLASTATLPTLTGQQLWLHRLTHQGGPTIRPSLPSMPSKGRSSSTENILPRHGVPAWNPANVQLGRYLEANRLSLLEQSA